MNRLSQSVPLLVIIKICFHSILQIFRGVRSEADDRKKLIEISINFQTESGEPNKGNWKAWNSFFKLIRYSLF